MNAIQTLVRIVTLAVILVLKIVEFTVKMTLILLGRGKDQVVVTTPKVRAAAMAGYATARADAPSKFAAMTDKAKASAKVKLQSIAS